MITGAGAGERQKLHDMCGGRLPSDELVYVEHVSHGSGPDRQLSIKMLRRQ